MNEYYDEKPKNDFEKPKNDFPRERGGCLSLFLIVIIAFNIFGLFVLCSQYSQVSRYASSGSLFLILGLAFAIECAVIACAVAVWNWKKWGYYGLSAAYVIQIVFTLCSGNILNLLGAVIGLVILFTLVNSKIDLFDN